MSDIQQQNLWKLFQWRLECFGYTLVESIVVLLPLGLVFRLGESIGGMIWYMMPKRRKTIMRNLRIAFAGEKDLAEIQRLAKASFRRAVGNLVSAARTARLSPDELKKVMYIENPELLDEALAKGSGVVLLLAHMGNWELLSRLVYQFPKNTKTGAFYRPLNNPLLDQRVLSRRQADGTRMFSKGDNPLHVASFLREGGVVGILADQRVGRRGEVTEFFGRVTRASPLPSLLARRSKSAVLALSVITEAPGHWKLVFVPVSDPPVTENCMRSLELMMKASPVDVFWLQDRWRTAVGRRRPLSNWVGSTTRCGRKHYRALLWLAGIAEDWRPPENWVHPDLIFEVVLDVDRIPPTWLPDSTRFHRVDAGANAKTLARAISSIDDSESLPLDFIITKGISKSLRKACLDQELPIVFLS